MLKRGFVLLDPDAWLSCFLGAGLCALESFSEVALGIVECVVGVKAAKDELLQKTADCWSKWAKVIRLDLHRQR